MDTYSEESQDLQRFSAYCQEVERIEKKLRNNIPQGKGEKLQFRLKYLKEKLIPKLLQRMGGMI